jgi:hypothetical protein
LAAHLQKDYQEVDVVEPECAILGASSFPSKLARNRGILPGDCGFRGRRTLIPKGTRTAFRAEGEQFSERSDAGISIVPEAFGFVKENLSGAQRRNSATRRKGYGERGSSPFPRLGT